MMKINRRIDYAIRVMLALAKQPLGSRLSTQQIQTTMLVPRAFLSRIIAELAKAKLIDTFPGPMGGVQLARSSDKINLKNIWEAIDGRLLISDCLENPEECPLNEGCPVNARWRKIQSFLVDELESTTLDNLAIEAFQLTAK
jgi:Rrf2 family iron-sulfur cluster assembly transcriptional regulator